MQKWGQGQGKKRAPSPSCQEHPCSRQAESKSCPGHPFGTLWPRNELPGAWWGKERDNHMGLMQWEERMSKVGGRSQGQGTAPSLTHLN